MVPGKAVYRRSLSCWGWCWECWVRVSADSFTDDDGGFYESALDALAERGILGRNGVWGGFDVSR